MKLIYNIYGVYGDLYWNVAYYIPSYLMTIALLRYVLFQTIGIARMFIRIVLLYFVTLLLIEVICLIDIDLYSKMIIEVNKYGIPAIILIFGLCYIKAREFVKHRKHDRKNKR
jgi:hypothetical protein